MTQLGGADVAIAVLETRSNCNNCLLIPNLLVIVFMLNQWQRKVWNLVFSKVPFRTSGNREHLLFRNLSYSPCRILGRPRGSPPRCLCPSFFWPSWSRTLGSRWFHYLEMVIDEIQFICKNPNYLKAKSGGNIWRHLADENPPSFPQTDDHHLIRYASLLPPLVLLLFADCSLTPPVSLW